MKVKQVWQQLQKLKSKYEAAMLAPNYESSVNEPAVVKYQVVGRLLTILEPAMTTGKDELPSSCEMALASYWADLKLFREKYNIATSGIFSELKKCVNELQIPKRVSTQQKELEDKVSQFLNGDQQEGHSYPDLMTEHPELIECIMTRDGGLERISQFLQDNAGSISVVMAAVEQFRLPLIRVLIQRAIVKSLPIAANLLHSQIKAIQRLPKELRLDNDVKEACEITLLSVAYKDKNDVHPILEEINKLPIDQQASLFIEDGNLTRLATSDHV